MNLTLLIDLDDTLLPFSSERFLPVYIERLTSHLSSLGPPKEIEKVLFAATSEAIQNTEPGVTIKETFDNNFYPSLNTTAEEILPVLDDFYTNIFPTLSPIAMPEPNVTRFIEKSIARGYQLVVATNPIFPQAATYERLRWAGLPPEKYPFVLISTYEDFHYAKPHPTYFAEILAQLGWQESPVLVVGNDLAMDIEPAQKLGLTTYWITDDYTNSTIKNGSGAGLIEELHDWIESKDAETLTPSFRSFDSSLDILRATPAALDTLLKGVPNQGWNLKPDPESWNLTEVVCHLRDVDAEVHIPRFKDLYASAAPFLEAVDADNWADERKYSQQNGKKALEDFFDARNELLDIVSSPPESVAQKEIRHSIFGPTTLDEITRIAARHDRLHLQQINSLVKVKTN
jgi:FMN phosphatase YigB (HAD superfamily)